MMVYKCDGCKKEIKDEQRNAAVRVSSGKLALLADLVLCKKCGSGIIKILRAKKLIKEKPAD